MTYTLHLKRNTVFATYILTLPCVFLVCLTIVVFWLPPDRPDRTSLGKSECCFRISSRYLFFTTWLILSFVPTTLCPTLYLYLYLYLYTSIYLYIPLHLFPTSLYFTHGMVFKAWSLYVPTTLYMIHCFSVSLFLMYSMNWNVHL